MQSRSRQILEFYKQLNKEMALLKEIQTLYFEANKRLSSYEKRMLRDQKSVLELNELNKIVSSLKQTYNRKKAEVSKLEEKIALLEQIHEVESKLSSLKKDTSEAPPNQLRQFW